jgi:signal transduction histidine kinase
MINSDRQRIMQVLLGLQSNAIKFTESGKVEINVKINVVGDDKLIEIAVLDTGIGIPYNEQDKLFKLFGFVNGTAAKNTKGVGLGLVISEQIVSQFDG